MRRILTGFLAAVLTLGLLAAGQAEAKVYKMKPEERAAALKEKKARKARKKAGKDNAAAPGGWVEVKPGTKPERKARKSATVDEDVRVGQKGKKGRKNLEADTRPEKQSEKKSGKTSRKAETAAEKKADKLERKQVLRGRGQGARHRHRGAPRRRQGAPQGFRQPLGSPVRSCGPGR